MDYMKNPAYKACVASIETRNLTLYRTPKENQMLYKDEQGLYVAVEFYETGYIKERFKTMTRARMWLKGYVI